MIALLAALLAHQSDPLEKELAEIVRRLDAAELADRESAVGELEAFARKAGAKAAEYLKRHADSASGEIRARVRGQLEFLARLDDCRKALAVFDDVGLPDCRGKTLAIYNPNRWWRSGDSLYFTYVTGWVISETQDSVTLTETNLTTATYRRNRTLPEDWDRFKDKHPKDSPLPGELRTIEFDDFCRKILAAGTKEDFGDFEHFRGGGLSHGLEPALFAFWALQRGDGKRSLELVDLSKKALAARGNRNDARPFPDALRDGVAGNLRRQAITKATGGEPRAELLKRWRTLESIAPDLHKGEPKTMVRLYEELGAEDAAWKNPSSDEVARMAPPARVAVWVHRLRDLAAQQTSDPGSCQVLGPWSGLAKGEPNPADELVKLGWDALPAVIEHLDDAHPSRSRGHWRSFAPDSYYLLRIGDCCQQVFEAITGFDIYHARSTSGAMVKDGDAPAGKAAAQKWWEEHRKEGAEKFHLKGLEAAETVAFAAEKLLELDAKKHLPRLMEILEKGDRGRRNSLLPLLRPHLTKDHRLLLESFLKDESLSAVEAVAWALWETCADDRGVLELIARLRAARDKEPSDDFFFFHGFDLMARVRSDAVVQGVCDLMGSPVVRLRMNAMSAAAEMPSRKMAEALVTHFGDASLTGWNSNYAIRYCDSAAEAVIRMLDLSKQFRLQGKDDERDRTISDLKAWWEKNRDAVDWAAHLRRIDEARAPRK